MAYERPGRAVSLAGLFYEVQTMDATTMDEIGMSEVKFSPGRLAITRGALEELSTEDVLLALGRHLIGDWGDVCQEDWRENEYSLSEGLRLWSVYHTREEKKFYVITEHDRSQTKVLLPTEY